MNLLRAVGNLDLDTWVRGLLSAGISGGAAAVTAGITLPSLDPDHFNFGAGKFYLAVGVFFFANATVSIFKFLSQHPLPDVKTVTTTVQTIEQDKAPTKVVTTVEETKIVPVKTGDTKAGE